MYMIREVYKYQAAGNDFIMVDGRKSQGMSAEYVNEDFIRQVCDRRYGIGADGLIVLEDSVQYDFRMVYYNSDGSGGMMCGNGGRALVAFASDLGYTSFCFDAADGLHDAQLLDDGRVRLKMKDVNDIDSYDSCSFKLDTGTKHLVRFVDGLKEYPVVENGRVLRYHEDFAPVGTNVNFVEPADGVLCVRTYEKGVEDETYACGTGIVASCISAFKYGVKPHRTDADGRVGYEVKALKDSLAVDFIPQSSGEGTAVIDIWLTGPASRIAKIDYFCTNI